MEKTEGAGKVPDYLLVMRGEAGCDYSIGCGVTIEHLAVGGDIAQAVEEAVKLIMVEHGDFEEQDVGNDIEEATLYAVVGVREVPLAELRNERVARLTAEALVLIEAQDRAELKRLQAKYGP